MAFACSLLVQACSGVTVVPTAPTADAEKVTQGSPTILRFSGAAQDGASFSGYILYGSRDVDSRPQFGRYQALHWEVYVTGGAATKDYRFSDTLGGRALLETYNVPSPTIGLVFLWPREDPTVEALTPHFHGNPGYNPDEAPTLEDFGEILPGEARPIPKEAGAVLPSRYNFGVFRDGQGGEELVRYVQFEPLATVPGVRQEQK
jgi:hypothetical protein